MVKRTSTIQLTIKDSKKLFNKLRRQRTSTIDETIATSTQGFKPKQKPTKTRTMIDLITQNKKSEVNVTVQSKNK